MFEGSLVALVTPMQESGAVDDEALDRLVQWHVEKGTHGIVAMGTTGECATLSHKEHMQVVKRCKEILDGRLPIIAGTGSNSTQEAVELAKQAEEIGVDACLSVVPYYNKPTQDGLFAHFEAVAKATSLPIILYNVPGRTVVDMSAETTARLAQIDNIIGIKEAEGSVERTQTLLKLCPDDFIVLSGEDPTACESMLAGAKGVISVTANVVPSRMAKMCELAVSGDVEAATEAARELDAMHGALFIESNPQPAKWLLQEMGIIEKWLRLPLLPLSVEAQANVRSVAKELGLI